MSIGPKARAGFMQAPVNAPAIALAPRAKPMYKAETILAIGSKLTSKKILLSFSTILLAWCGPEAYDCVFKCLTLTAAPKIVVTNMKVIKSSEVKPLRAVTTSSFGKMKTAPSIPPEIQRVNEDPTIEPKH